MAPSAALLLLGSLAAAAARKAQLGPRPEWLVERMSASPLKSQLKACLDDDDRVYESHPFSISHRGAPMQYPEHTEESYRAGITMGAGIVECDVAVTRDGELVCRHAQCDLHLTTNILLTPLAARCHVPFTGANGSSPAQAECCTSDITLAEFETLCGKNDGANAAGETVEEYMAGTPPWKSELHSLLACPRLMSHRASIRLIKAAGRQFTPELKFYHEDKFGGQPPLTYDALRAKVVQEYVEEGVPPSDVWPQSFNPYDIMFWTQALPEWGQQAVFLGGPYYHETWAAVGGVAGVAAIGAKYLSSMIFDMVSVGPGGFEVADWVANATRLGISLIAWTLEKYSGVEEMPLQSMVFPFLDVLAREVGVVGVFSDWPATTTFYANCVLRTPAAKCYTLGTCADAKRLFKGSGCCGSPMKTLA